MIPEDALDVRIHLVALNEEAPASSVIAMLDEHERNRAARFVHPRDRHFFIHRRVALRRILASSLAIEPAQVSYETEDRGRLRVSPHINDRQVQFSVSSSDSLALIAIAGNVDLGVDVESVRPFTEMELVAKTVFTEDELSTIITQPVSLQAEAFFAAWTRLEASVKATGSGLAAYPPPGNTRERAVTPRVWCSNWSITRRGGSQTFAAALATSERRPRVTWVVNGDFKVESIVS